MELSRSLAYHHFLTRTGYGHAFAYPCRRGAGKIRTDASQEGRLDGRKR